MLFGEGPQIKNIAADLNKLFRQGSLLNQIGQTVEGDSTADQGTSDLLAARDPVIQEISVGMSGEQAARYTVSGTPPLSLPNSLGKPLKAWSVDLLPYQEGTGDPAPDNVRPIHGTDKVTITTAGKNLCNAPNDIVITNAGNIGNQLCAIPAGTYVYSATSANTAAYQLTVFDTNGVQIISIASPQSYQGRSSLIFTITRNAAYIRCYYNASTIVSDIQVEAGSTATPYTPYLAPSQTVITLPSTVYNGTVGSEGGESRWGEVDLGTLNWAVNNEEAHIFLCNPPNIKPIASGDYTGRNKNAICEAYKPSTSISISSSMDDMSWLRTVTQYYVRDTNYSALSDFVASVSGVKLIYELESPVQFPLTAPPIPTPKGSATTWATAEDGTVDSMEVTYVGEA